nr:MAG TPA: hypothetical protein [Caudoviricetes sp.]
MRRSYQSDIWHKLGGRNTRLIPNAHLFGDMPWQRVLNQKEKSV